MKIAGLLSAEQSTTLTHLRNLNRHGLRQLFGTLQPPPMRSLDGEYDAELLDQGGTVANRLTRVLFGSSGPWIGKAFSPVSETEGVGYNCFRYGDRDVAKLPMRTSIAESRIDDRDSLVISYREENRGLVRWLVGELREVSATVVLGFGTFGPRVGDRDPWRRKIPFVMVGPLRQYRTASMQFRSPLDRLLRSVGVMSVF